MKKFNCSYVLIAASIERSKQCKKMRDQLQFNCTWFMIQAIFWLEQRLCFSFMSTLAPWMHITQLKHSHADRWQRSLVYMACTWLLLALTLHQCVSNSLSICIWLERLGARVEVRGHTCSIISLHLIQYDMSQWSSIPLLVCGMIWRSDVHFAQWLIRNDDECFGVKDSSVVNVVVTQFHPRDQ